MALLGLGLQQWLSKGPATGLAYISSQVGNLYAGMRYSLGELSRFCGRWLLSIQ